MKLPYMDASNKPQSEVCRTLIVCMERAIANQREMNIGRYTFQILSNPNLEVFGRCSHPIICDRKSAGIVAKKVRIGRKRVGDIKINGYISPSG